MRTDFMNEKVQTGLVKQIQGKWIINVVKANMTKTKKEIQEGNKQGETVEAMDKCKDIEKQKAAETSSMLSKRKQTP